MTQREAKARVAFHAWLELMVRGTLAHAEGIFPDDASEAEVKRIDEAIKGLSYELWVKSKGLAEEWCERNEKLLDAMKASED
jgi:hypothetical protein